jgi:phosphoribosylglycinamide formyltransferase-1
VPAPEPPDRTRRRRERLIAIARSLPEAQVAAVGAGHLSFCVGRRVFAYHLDDHHGDGKVALCCKAPLGEQETLVQLAPDHYYVPAYLGSQGWVSLRLDTPRVDWAEVESLVREAYRLVAPKKLLAKLG